MEEEKIIVAFFKVPLQVKYEALADVLDDNPLIADALSYYLADLPREVEVWKIEKNIAVTELGYFIAMEQTPDVERLIEENQDKIVMA